MDAAFDIGSTSDSDLNELEPASAQWSQPPPRGNVGQAKRTVSQIFEMPDVHAHSCFSEEVVNEEASQEPLSYTISIYIIAQMKKDPKK